MNTMTFKEAIKLVHPDSNPHITDAGVKVSAIMLYKNDEACLYRLINNWGLLKGQTPNNNHVLTYTQVLFKMWPNSVYNGNVKVQMFGSGEVFDVQKTTKTRAYFTKATISRTGKTWTPFNKIRNSFYYKMV